jgi:outer membrane protein OmpA-like peptidoglycan-associated protein
MSMGLGVRVTICAVAVSVFGAGCIATEQWTQDLFAKRQAEVDDRFVKVETVVRKQGERMDRIEVRIADLATGLAPAKSVPTTTKSVPPPAKSVPDGRTLVGVVHVPFAFDRADLDVTAEAALVAIVKELRGNPDVTVDLEGATDPVGRLDYNRKLSQRRVDVVKHWLVQKGVDPNRIVGETARGPLPDGSIKNDLKRRVTVKLMKSAA